MQNRHATHAKVPQGQGPVFGTSGSSLVRFADTTIVPPVAIAQLISGTPLASVAALKAITNGAFAATINGTVTQVGPINFSTIGTYADAAALIATALGTAATCDFASPRLMISTTPVSGSTITVAAAPAAGTDVSALLCLTAATGAYIAS